MSVATGSFRAFERRSEWDPDRGQYVSRYAAECSRCGFTDAIPASARRNGALATEVILKKFQERGWATGKNRNHDVCPKCLKAEAEENQRRAAERQAAKDKAEKELAAAQADHTTPDDKLFPIVSEEITVEVRALTGRLRLLQREADFLNAMIMALVDRHASVETNINSLVRDVEKLVGGEIEQAAPPSAMELSEESMFERIRQVRSPARADEPLVQISFYSKAKYPQTNFHMTKPVATAMGFTKNAANRCYLSVGKKEHHGLVLIERAEADAEDSLAVTIEPSGAARVSSSRVIPANTQEKIGKTTVTHATPEDGKLILKLPEEFFDRDRSAITETAA